MAIYCIFIAIIVFLFNCDNYYIFIAIACIFIAIARIYITIYCIFIASLNCIFIAIIIFHCNFLRFYCNILHFYCNYLIFIAILLNFTGQGSELFRIDPIDGVIEVESCIQNCLDYESVRAYYLSVTATDNNGEGKKTVVNLRISVADANDNPPIFIQRNYKTR